MLLLIEHQTVTNRDELRRSLFLYAAKAMTSLLKSAPSLDDHAEPCRRIRYLPRPDAVRPRLMQLDEYETVFAQITPDGRYRMFCYR